MVSFFFTLNVNDKTLFPGEALSELGMKYHTSSYQHICVQMGSASIIYVDTLEII